MRLSASFFVIALLWSCAALTPPTDPPTGKFECTPTEHSCNRHACCPNGYDCGGTSEFAGCPADACCDNGGADSPVDTFGAKKRVKQRTR